MVVLLEIGQVLNTAACFIGDAMVDKFIVGRVTRISPEAPVPVVNVTKKESRLGGAGNVVDRKSVV